MHQLRQLEDENGALKQLLAELHVEQCDLQEHAGKRLTTRGQRCDVALGVMWDYKASRRRACGLIGVDAKTVGRERSPDHGAIREAMREIAGQRSRFGYSQIAVMLERKGRA